MDNEKIHHLKDNEKLILIFDSIGADSIYNLIAWLDGWQEDRHRIPGAWDLTMAYRSGKIIEEENNA